MELTSTLFRMVACQPFTLQQVRSVTSLYSLGEGYRFERWHGSADVFVALKAETRKHAIILFHAPFSLLKCAFLPCFDLKATRTKSIVRVNVCTFSKFLCTHMQPFTLTHILLTLWIISIQSAHVHAALYHRWQTISRMPTDSSRIWTFSIGLLKHCFFVVLLAFERKTLSINDSIWSPETSKGTSFLPWNMVESRSRNQIETW